MLLQKGFEFEPFQSQIPVNHSDSTELARRKWTMEYILYTLNFPGFTEFLKTGKSTSIFRSKKLYAICKKTLTNFFNWRGIRERGREDSLAAPFPAVFPAHISFIEPSPQSERVEHTKNESNSEAFAKNNCLLVHENETNRPISHTWL